MILNRYKQSTGRLKAVVVLAALALIVGGLFGWGVGAGAAQAQEVRLPLGGTAAANAPTGLYDTPALDGKLLLTLPLNAQATVMGGPFNEGWYWLDYKGTVGYAPGKTLVVVDANYKPVVLATPTATRTATPVPTNTPTATPKPASPYLNLWVGEMAVRSSVKSGPGSNTSTVKSWWAGRRVLVYAEAKDSTGNLWYRVSDPP